LAVPRQMIVAGVMNGAGRQRRIGRLAPNHRRENEDEQREPGGSGVITAEPYHHRTGPESIWTKPDSG
jgi:hypothetical protein